MKDVFDQTALSTACRNLEGLFIRTYPVCDSTNNRAKEWLLSGDRGEALFAAAEQTAGRGRQGRGFYSPAGSGVYFTVACTPREPLGNIVGITSAAAVATMRAIRELSGRQCEIKWVNDLLLNGKKICGILAEAVTIGDRTSVLVGIGINLRPANFPPELAEIAGSVGDAETPRVELIAAVTRNLFPYLRDPGNREWLDDYRRHSCVVGKEIAFSRGGVVTPAIAVGINDAGELTVRTERGTETLRTGEITLRLR